jgi:hypothetical protein
VRAALAVLVFGSWSASAVAQQTPDEAPTADASTTDAAATDAAPGDPAHADTDDDGADGASPEAPDSDDDALSLPAPDTPAEAASDDDAGQTGVPSASGAAPAEPPAGDKKPGTGERGDATGRPGRDWWKGADRVPGEQPAVQVDPGAPTPKPAELPPPRSGPYLSIGAAAGACAAASCLGPLCTLGGAAGAIAWLFVSPPALFSVAPCISGGMVCGGLGGGLCATGVGGSAATTGAAAAAPYYDAGEDGAAWDAFAGGLPGIVLGAAALLVAPLAIGAAFITVDRALWISGAPLAPELITSLLIFVVLPLGLLPSLLMAAVAPIVTLVGITAARMQYASSGPEADLVTAAPPVPRARAVAMRF